MSLEMVARRFWVLSYRPSAKSLGGSCITSAIYSERLFLHRTNIMSQSFRLKIARKQNPTHLDVACKAPRSFTTLMRCRKSLEKKQMHYLGSNKSREHHQGPRGLGIQVAARTEAKTELSTSADDSKTSILTLPTVLTLTRVAAIPALIAVWFGASSHSSPYLTAGIFSAACITDFLDGYLARKMGTHSPFGAFLDPVADKLMVSTVLILLSSRPFVSGSFAGNAWLMPTIASAIIGREIAMSALREWAASLGSEAHNAVAVSPLGKWKTTTQMVSLVFLLASSGGSRDSMLLEACATAGPPLLMVAAFLTVYSLYEYFRGLWKYLV